MEIDTIALIIAIASFIGVIAGPIITNIISLNAAQQERSEARRKQRLDYLLDALAQLIDMRAKLQFWQAAQFGREREEAYGRAFAVILSIPYQQVRVVAEKIMLGGVSAQGNEKLDAINEAIRQLSDIVDDIMRKK